MAQSFSASQLRAARALLDWSRADLAEQCGVSEPTIHRFENNMGEPELRTQEKIRRVFDENGIEFTDNHGVRFKPQNVEIFEGKERFGDFYDFLYWHLKRHGGDVCINIYDETLLAKYRKDPELHRKRMKELVARGDVSFRILTSKSDFISYDYAQFKWQPQQHATSTGFYAFGDCLALISFVHHAPPYVMLLKTVPFTEAYRQSFNIAWQNAKEPPQLQKK